MTKQEYVIGALLEYLGHKLTSTDIRKDIVPTVQEFISIAATLLTAGERWRSLYAAKHEETEFLKELLRATIKPSTDEVEIKIGSNSTDSVREKGWVDSYSIGDYKSE